MKKIQIFLFGDASVNNGSGSYTWLGGELENFGWFQNLQQGGLNVFTIVFLVILFYIIRFFFRLLFK